MAETFRIGLLGHGTVGAAFEGLIAERLGAPVESGIEQAPPEPEATVAEMRAWARSAGLAVPDRGRLRPEVRAAWRAAHRLTAGRG